MTGCPQGDGRSWTQPRGCGWAVTRVWRTGAGLGLRAVVLLWALPPAWGQAFW